MTLTIELPQQRTTTEHRKQLSRDSSYVEALQYLYGLPTKCSVHRLNCIVQFSVCICQKIIQTARIPLLETHDFTRRLM